MFMLHTEDITALPDEYLFEKFKETSEENYFNELAKRYYASALSMARIRLFNKGNAEDVVQEAFLRIIKKCGTHKSGMLFAPWFYMILKNTCADFARKEIVRKNGESGIISEIEIKSPESALSFEETIKCLSAEEQEILICRFIYNLTFPEIAIELDLPLENIKKKAQRALKKLRNKLSLKS